MRFFALKVTCEACRHAFLVGGATANDLDVWRDAQLACPRCRAACRATDGDVVGLSSRRRRVDPGPPFQDVTRHADAAGSWLGLERRAGVTMH
jgi:hypothetical protein